MPNISLNLRVVLTLYRLIWWVCTPVILLYLYLRSRREPAYIKHLADTFSEMGLWYACSAHALIGGSFCDVEGHNPWEALQL